MARRITRQTDRKNTLRRYGTSHVVESFREDAKNEH